MRLTTRAVLSLAVLGATSLAATPASAATATATAVDDNYNACPASRVLDPGFQDVPVNSIFARDIACIYDYAIAAGKDATHYAPGDVVLRQHMALFIWNFLDGMGVAPTDNSDHGFVDLSGVPQAQVDAINELANAGLVNGYDATHFGPGDGVRRDQMATFLNRAQKPVDGHGFATTADFFDDDKGDTHEANINAIASVGITAGRGGARNYDPAALVHRDQMAAFLARDLEANIRVGTLATSVFSIDQTYYARAGGDVSAPVGGQVNYTFANVTDPGPHIAALFPCHGSNRVGNGAASGDPYSDTFGDTNTDGRADGMGSTDSGAATFSTGTRVINVSPSNNQVSVQVTSGATDCAVVVLFGDTDGDGQLAVDSFHQATKEPYAATGELSFVAAS